MQSTPPLANTPETTPLIVVTGLSGAGKSTAMRVLEDLGYYCIDNLPPALIPDFFELFERGAHGTSDGAVIACDVRSGALFNDMIKALGTLEEQEVPTQIIFLDCSTDTLIRRFQEVRRAHPLEAGGTLPESIEEERARLEPIRAVASTIIDTTQLDTAGLRAEILHATEKQPQDAINIDFLSFGFKHGLPRAADFLFDTRFLPNPFYEDELRDLSGQDDAVYNFVMSSPLAEGYLAKITALIDSTIGPFVKIGKMRLTVAIGCTGGRHRSVSFARRLADHYVSAGRNARAVHRDIGKHRSG